MATHLNMFQGSVWAIVAFCILKCVYHCIRKNLFHDRTVRKRSWKCVR